MKNIALGGAADEAFGQVKYLRVWLEEQDVFHMVATRCNDDVSARGIGYGRVDALIDRLPARAWRRMSCGDGAHGPRVYDWSGCRSGRTGRPGEDTGCWPGAASLTRPRSPTTSATRPAAPPWPQ
jgi:hypothetical protein